MSKKKAPSLKHVVDTPFQLQWPSIEERCAQKTINLLKECLSDIKYVTLKDSKRKIKRPQLESFDKERVDIKKNHLVIGINAVTRCLERGNMRGGVVCLSAKPPLLTGHLLILATTRKCPVMAINNMSSKLAPVLGINSVLALGFKKLTDDCTSDPFSDIIDHLIKSTPSNDIPWLSTANVLVASNRKEGQREKEEKENEEGNEEEGNEKEVEDVGPPCEKRLKQEEGIQEEKNIVDNKQYVTLQVKTVVITNKKEK